MKSRIYLVVSFSLLIFAIFIKVAGFQFIEQLQLRVFDAFQKHHPRTYTPQPVRIVDIDEESLDKIGQWPWPRTKIAELVDRLTELGVAAIAFDVLFAEADRTSPKNVLAIWGKNELAYLLEKLPDHDVMLAKSIENSNVVVGYVFSNLQNNDIPKRKAGFSYAGKDPISNLTAFKGVTSSLPIFEEAALGNGALNSVPDADGIIRRVPLLFNLNGSFYPALSAEALRVAQGASTYLIKTTGSSSEADFGDEIGDITAIKIGNFIAQTDWRGAYWVHYTEYVSERYVPVWKIFEGDAPRDLLEGNIVFVGTSAAGLKDVRATPLNPVTSGVEIHAQVVEQILSDHILSRPDWMHGAEILSMFVAGIILILLMAKLSAVWGIMFMVFAFAASLSFSWHMFVNNGILVEPVTPSIVILILYISGSLSKFISTEHEKSVIRHAFSRYMTPALVDELASNPEKLTLGGQMKEITVMFCDVRGFTTISEQYDSHSLTNFINSFLTPLTAVVMEHRGTIDKYMGDCIMAFWNAPLDDKKHAENACFAAIDMIKALDSFNREMADKAKAESRNYMPIKVGIGINTGNCCVGNMGSEQRFDYSVLGDDVNLASRLEQQNKTYGADIVIGEATKLQLSSFAVLHLDSIKVKGKTKPVEAFAVLGDKGLLAEEKYQFLVDNFAKMIQAYRVREWQRALDLLTECEKKCSSVPHIDIEVMYKLYKERIATFMQYPPDEDWDGVFDAVYGVHGLRDRTT